MLHEELVTQDLRDFLSQQVEEDAFSGCVLIAHQGVPVFQEAYGLAEQNFAVPNQLTTKFNLASVTKTLTAMAIMLLVQRGEVKLDDPLGFYLPDCPRSETITIHHLLTHTAGLAVTSDHFHAPNLFESAEKGDSDWLADLSLLPSSLQQLSCISAPGERFIYSNEGYGLLGLIIETVTQQGYFSWIRENLYQKLGMVNTDAYRLDAIVGEKAYGYTFGGMRGPFHDPSMAKSRARRCNFSALVPYKSEPAGGVYSTVLDMLLFTDALRNATFLRPQYTDMMLSGKINVSSDIRYGYGIHEQFIGDERIISHGGALHGWNSSFEIYLQSGYTVIVLANYDPPCAFTVADKIRRLIMPA